MFPWLRPAAGSRDLRAKSRMAQTVAPESSLCTRARLALAALMACAVRLPPGANGGADGAGTRPRRPCDWTRDLRGPHCGAARLHPGPRGVRKDASLPCPPCQSLSFPVVPCMSLVWPWINSKQRAAIGPAHNSSPRRSVQAGDLGAAMVGPWLSQSHCPLTGCRIKFLTNRGKTPH